MENNQDDSFLQMNLDTEGGHILTQTVRWSRFLAIVGIVGITIFLLGLALAGSFLLAAISKLAPGLDALAGLGSAIVITFVFVIFGVFGFVVYMLYRFSVLTRRAIDQQDQTMLAEGMRCLKIYFLTTGIFAILGLLGNLLTITKLFH